MRDLWLEIQSVPGFVEIYLFIIGAVTGSFLNVCIYRIPIRKSIVLPASSCPNCGTAIRWFHNIPIVSYIFLRGRCANCKTGISPVYPFVEFLTAVLFVLLYRFFGPSIPFLIYLLFACSMIVLIFIDFYHQILPHRITFPGIAIGFVSSFVNPFVRPIDSALGILVGGLLPTVVLMLYKWIRKREGLGHGDIFMLAMVGAFLGWRQVVIVLFLSSLLGSIVGLSLMLIQKRGADLMLPFGTFIGAAGIFAVFYGRYFWRLLFYF
jgi:leader peptidase (prepilin peptidase)/N-methyltransferase